MEKYIKTKITEVKTSTQPQKCCFWKNSSQCRNEILEFLKKDRPETFKKFFLLSPEDQAKEYKNAYHRNYLKKTGRDWREYYHENYDKVKASQKKWRENNRDRFLKIMREYQRRKRREAGILPKISPYTQLCPCGGRSTPYNLKIHINTKRHKKWLDKQSSLTSS